MQFLLPFLNFTSQCILYIIPSINTLCSQKSMCNLYLALHIQVSSILSFTPTDRRLNQPQIMQYCSTDWKKFMYEWTQAIQICVVQGQTVIYFIYPFTDGHLDCLYLRQLRIMLEHGRTSIWVPAFMFFWVYAQKWNC